MSKLYRSPYEAYPFLADKGEDLRCDFEILTDQICSGIAYLEAILREKEFLNLSKTLLKLNELVYHANPSLRTFCSITIEEVLWLKEEIDAMQGKINISGFVLPYGSKEASYSHILRTQGKELVRMLYRHIHQGNQVSELLIDFCNLLSAYFFTLSIYINMEVGIVEIPFKSRNY